MVLTCPPIRTLIACAFHLSGFSTIDLNFDSMLSKYLNLVRSPRSHVLFNSRNRYLDFFGDLRFTGSHFDLNSKLPAVYSLAWFSVLCPQSPKGKNTPTVNLSLPRKYTDPYRGPVGDSTDPTDLDRRRAFKELLG